jgi:hypothetical protein
VARFLAGRVPGAALTVFAGEGHMLVFPHIAEILGTLVASLRGRNTRHR